MSTNSPKEVPAYTPEEAVKKSIEVITRQIADKHREQTILEGEISALQTTLANIKHWQSATKFQTP